MQPSRYCLHCNLSVERFEAYCRPGEGSVPAIARYLWNIQLCEALYPTLNCVEIGIRNSVNNSLANEYGAAWYDEPGLLGPYELDSIADARLSLQKTNKPDTPARIVSELSFGFWTRMMSRQYYSPNNEHLKPWPRLTKSTFPHVPNKQRFHTQLAAWLNEVRVLRNRVSHHEPIWHYADLGVQYERAKELATWMAPAVALAMDHIDRFPTILAGGSIVHHATLEEIGTWDPILPQDPA